MLMGEYVRELQGECVVGMSHAKQPNEAAACDTNAQRGGGISQEI
jgi:hypothetical protein